MLKHLACLLMVSTALAQEISPLGPVTPATPSLPVIEPIQPAPQPPANVPVTLVAPASLPGVTATLSSPLTLKGRATLVLKLNSTLKTPVKLMTNRDNRQDCVFAPSVRVVKVGTREVAYPNGSGNVKLCAQDMKVASLPAGGSTHFTRTLDLPTGEYMIEGWFLGSADGTRVKIDAAPIRVTVK